jgi:hypothetical protein
MTIYFQGNDHLIEYNLFERACNDSDDMGVIYSGRDPSARGTVIRYNCFSDIFPSNHNISVCGIYIDDGSGGMAIQSNLFYKVGNPGHFKFFGSIFLHAGFENHITDNIFIDCQRCVGYIPWLDKKWTNQMTSAVMTKRLREDVDILSDLYQERYPVLRDFYNIITNRPPNYVEDNFYANSGMGAIKKGLSLRGNKSFSLEVSGGLDDIKRKKDSIPQLRVFPFEKVGIQNVLKQPCAKK